jgi:mannose-1-phosphate guanylyltransferase
VDAVVLVGGFGTRLRPLTLSRPKQMLPVVDRPMIEWVIERLVAVGVGDVVLSMGYLPDAFRQAYPAGLCAGARLHYAVEPEPLDTAGAIRFAAAHAGLDRRDEPFLVVNGDVVARLDLPALLALHRRSGAEATIALHQVDDPSRYGVVPIAGDGRVTAFIEKPPAAEAPSRWINAGTYVLEPSVVGRIAGGRKVSIERETFPRLVAEGRLYGHQDDGYWIDAGTVESYVQVQLDLVVERYGPGASHIDPEATIAPDATVERSVVMAGATVAEGATVRGSVLLPKAVVGRGAVVADSVLGAGARLGERARLADGSAVGDEVDVPDGMTLSGGRVPDPADAR